MFKRLLTEKPMIKKLVLFEFTYSHFLILQGLFLGILLYRLIVLRIYPSPPLYFNPDDTFIDFFLICFETLQKDEAYTAWGSIYPPFAHLFCYLPYLLIDPNQDLVPGGDYKDLRLTFLYSLPLLLNIFSYFISIYFLIVVHCKSSFNFRKRLLIFISLILTVPSLWLIERGNLLMYCVTFINIAFIISYQKNPVYTTYWQTILMSAAAAIKPYLLPLILIFKKANYIVVFIFNFILLNFLALWLWQPKSPEMLFSNIAYLKTISTVSLVWLASYSFYNFSIPNLPNIILLAKAFLSGYQLNLAISGLLLIIFLCLAILIYNCYKFFILYTKFHDLLSNTFLMFLSYSFCQYLLISLLVDPGGYGMTFLIPSVVLFISYFPKAKFNFYEFAIISFIWFFIPFLPEHLYNEDFRPSYLSQLIGIPLKTLSPTFTIDPLFRPIFFQLFFTVFIAKAHSEIKGALSKNSRIQLKQIDKAPN